MASNVIEADDFKVWGAVYRWQREHLTMYSVLPTRDQIKGRWPEWEPPDGEMAYWLTEMKRMVLALRAQQILRDALLAVEGDPTEAIGQTVAQLARLRARGNSHVSTSDESASGRFEKYERRAELWKQSDGDFILGIPTGLETLDDTHIGWMPSELVGFYARPTTGKTWMLVREGAIAWANGYKVAMISPEMSVGMIELRIDVFMARAMGVTLSHQGILTGNPEQRDSYKSYTDAVKEHKRWWTFDNWNGKSFTVNNIIAMAEQHEPNLILIDGVYLLRSEKRRETAGWEKMEEFCEGLKHFATAANIVIMMSHQSVNVRRGQRGERDGAGGRGDDWIMPSLNDAAGGDALVRNCSSVFTICSDKDMGNVRWYSIRKTRERHLKFVSRMALKWNVDSGDISDLGKYGDNTGAIRSVVGPS